MGSGSSSKWVSEYSPHEASGPAALQMESLWEKAPGFLCLMWSNTSTQHASTTCPFSSCHLQPVTGAAKDLPLSSSTQSSSGSVPGQELRRSSTVNPRAQHHLWQPAPCSTKQKLQEELHEPCLVPEAAHCLSSHPHHCPRGCSGMQTPVMTAESGRARGHGQLLHFPPTKSQKWQKVKAHQHVKTLVIIKTFFFFVKSPPGNGVGD